MATAVVLRPMFITLYCTYYVTLSVAIKLILSSGTVGNGVTNHRFGNAQEVDATEVVDTAATERLGSKCGFDGGNWCL